MATKPQNPSKEPDEIGKAHPTDADLDGSERARDEQRGDDRPKYGGGPWTVADERGERRFGHARNDDADPSELPNGQHPVDDDEWRGPDAIGGSKQVSADDDGGTESSAQQAGFGRGEKPMKPKARAKKSRSTKRK